MIHSVALGFLAHPTIHTHSCVVDINFDLQVKNLTFCLLIEDDNEVCFIAQGAWLLIIDDPLHVYTDGRSAAHNSCSDVVLSKYSDR